MALNRRRAHRPVQLTDPERLLAYAEWGKSARERGDYRPERKIMTAEPVRVYVVIGSMPYEFQEVRSIWDTKLGAEVEAARLEALARQREAGSSQDAENDARYAELGFCSDFWVADDDHVIQHYTGPNQP